MNDEFAYAMIQARQKLKPAARPDRAPLKALAAAAFFAVAAIGFAASAILAPPIEHSEIARRGVE